jgi:dienelactone hydrolase
VDRPFPAYDGDGFYVFVCYAHADSDIVYPEISWLRDHGINVWYDEGITPGEEFPERLGKAILGASLVLFYASPRSVGSRHCRNEVFFSIDRETPVLAIHIEKTDLPPGLALSTGTNQAIMRYELSKANYRRKLLAGLAELTASTQQIEVDPELIAPPTLPARLRPLAWPVAVSVIAGMLIWAGVQVNRYLEEQSAAKWVHDEAMPKLRTMVQDQWRDFTGPYALAVEVEKITPDDKELQAILEAISVEVDIGSEPPGAQVAYKNYGAPEGEWISLGTTPVEDVRLPIGIFRWKFELEGYTTTFAAESSWDLSMSGRELLQANRIDRTLDRSGELPTGMVRVKGAETRSGMIGDFFVDRYEVTNAQFQEFIDAGGYSNPEFWQHEFVEDGLPLSWEDGISRFIDSTDRPGPSSWVGGHYPDRLGDHPVSGVSWYEAAAYAQFVGKELPSSDHWGLARGENSPMIMFPQLGGFAIFAPFSNVGGNGTVPVGSLPGITANGAYDLAGNVREWCSNRASIGHVVRGGSWADNPYDFGAVVHAPSIVRLPGYGFRTAIYPEREKIPDMAFADIATTPAKDFRKFEPVSDEVFEVYLNQFEYDRESLQPEVISIDDSHPEWTLERVSIKAPYGSDRIIVNLFLPKNAAPPYHTVVYVPGSAALFQQSSEDIANYYEIPLFLSFLMKNGYAVVLPTYQGTFERWDQRHTLIHYGAKNHAFTEFVVQVVKDFRRTLDYLETRDDIDVQKLAYYGMSWGGLLSNVIAAVEQRIATAIVLAGGLIDAGRPEINPLNYASRIDVPLLMMNGEYDTIHGFEYSAAPMFEMVATPEEHKLLKVYATDHIPPKNEYVKEILNWLEKYFGPVP